MSNIGDTKTINKFCWYPKKINKKWVWLRFYSETYEYREDLVRREIPLPNVVYEDGSAVYGSSIKFIPLHYVWKKTKRWVKTKQNENI
jgi:hypothetical protein